MNKLEVLAPVGNMENFYAAVDSGADAVYLGLPKFNARIKADNITEDNLREIVIYAHLHNCKVYVTLNTILWNEELDEVVSYIDTLVAAKVDAFIVQDYAVVHLLTSRYKGVEIHASTQMGIHNLQGALVAESMGISRVVLSREAKLEDIKLIKANTNLEIEYFVQGALCVAFSGNCYFSALRTGGSGNRGECKQLCRMPYIAKLEDTTVGEGYLLSARDLCLVPMLKDLIDAGVTSFKIEGRLRRASYVALATKTYKQILNAITNNKPVNEKAYIKNLSKVFNRGSYIEAYLNPGTPDNVINKVQQNHIGECIGSVSKVSPFKNGLYKIELSLSTDIAEGDGLKFMLNDVEVGSLGVGNVERNGKNYVIFSKRFVKVGASVHLCVDSRFENSLMPEKPRIKVSVSFKAQLDSLPTFTISNKLVTVTATGQNTAQIARSQPICKENIIETANKLDKMLEVTQVEATLDNVFIVKSELNELRRVAEKMFLDAYIQYLEKDNNPQKQDYVKPVIENTNYINSNLSLVYDDYDITSLSGVCVAFNQYTKTCIKDYFTKNKIQDKLYIYLPIIANHKDLEIINEALSMVDKSRIVLVANNIYALYYIGEGYSVIAGPNLNVANSLSYYHLTSMGVKDVVWSIENNDTSLGIGYEGNAVMMTLAHCPFKTLYANKCNNCSYQKGLKICTPTSEYKVHRYSISQCYFELINDENCYSSKKYKLTDLR
ncbi:MAG: U32 family peptidase [Clostridia bacterium]|nr:U32 family peptidase [Clostridia bacterium]